MTAKLTVLLEGQPLRTSEGSVGFCATLLVEGRYRMVIDPGHAGRQAALQRALSAHGLESGDIDRVLLTHVHWDHSQNIHMFPDAELLLHPAERAYASDPQPGDIGTPPWTGPMVEAHPAIVEVDEGHELDDGVGIIHTPGHSVGSICVVVDGESGTEVIAGDVIHYAYVAQTGESPFVFWNHDQSRAAIARITELADTIYPGHDRPFRLENGEIVYLRPFHLRLGGVPIDRVGLEWDDQPRERFSLPGT